MQDITARKAAEAAMRESEARFRALVQNDPDVILIVDDTMRATFVSPSAREAFGVPPETLLGPLAPALRFIHPADLEGALAQFGGLGGRPGAVATAEVRIKRRGQGWRWFLITAANRLDAPGIDGYLLNLRDITDRKEAALALEAALDTQRTAIAELEWLNQSKSRFLSTISHEFRTPLTAIIGYSEFLAANAGNPIAVAEDAAVIHREASRLNRMVDDVLLLDRVDAGRLPLQREPLDVNALVEDVVDAFRPLTDRHQIVLALAGDLRAVAGDHDRMLQAITNLVSNAVKYSPGGGDGHDRHPQRRGRGAAHRAGPRDRHRTGRFAPHLRPLRAGRIGQRRAHLGRRGWASPSCARSPRCTAAASGPRANRGWDRRFS